jgi:hypothetical protein
VTSSPEQKASDYLKETLGDALTKILTECTESLTLCLIIKCGDTIPLTQVKSSPEQKASDYLKETLGDALTKILTECTEKRLADTLLNIKMW